jgi:hypothetical protein
VEPDDSDDEVPESSEDAPEGGKPDASPKAIETPAVALAAPGEPAAASDVLDAEGKKPIIPRPEKAEES